MHIGFLTSDLHHKHGWGHYSLSLIQALRRMGIETTIITARNSPVDLDFPILPLLPNVAPAESGQLLKFLRLTPTIRHTLRHCDLVHCTIEPYAPLAMWAARQPYVITGHGSYAQAGISRHPLIRPLHRASFRRADRVICVSHYTEKAAQAYTPGIQTAVVNNGVDLERFSNLPTLPQPVNRPTVLTAGGIKRRKGTLPLIQAIAVVRESIPDVQCIVLGRTDSEPDYFTQVQQVIAELNLENHVHLHGFVSEKMLLGWYRTADVFVLPSINDGWKFEGYGLVHMEASAAGLPVIGTRDCGAEDAIADGINGFLVNQNNLIEELPNAILSILENSRLARQMGQAGLERARANTWDAAARRMINIYQEVLNS